MINDPFYLDRQAYREYGFKAILWSVKNWFSNLPYLIKSVKWFFQRGYRGWADCDWWNMNNYLCEIIIPMLKELKENKHGCPSGLDEDFEVAEKRWNEHIDDMIEAFEAAKRVLEDEYYKEVSGDSIEAIRNASGEEINKWWALSKEDQKLFNKKIKIFIKHFFSLWD